MILVVDDDATVRMSLGLLLKRAGYTVTAVATPGEALDVVRGESPEVIIMDMNYSSTTTGEDGLTLLRQVKIFRPEVPVILITAWGSIELAVEGMKRGAFDFITKPWDNRLLLSRIETGISLARDGAVPRPGHCSDENRFEQYGIIGRNKALLKVLETVERVAPTDASVLITGENGTGKELVAKAIHDLSRRSSAPLVKVNLGGISQSLFESEMFGHARGAFTGAAADRKGRFEMADGGTIFLDEIGDLDFSCQVKLLRVLQEHTFEVLGDSRPRRVDIRVVSATNADLPAMVREKRFREDLLYRINLITLHLPALRERREDISLLVTHFASQSGHDVEFTPEAMELLTRYPYPGNIRELRNLVERIIIVSGKSRIGREDVETVAGKAGQGDGDRNGGDEVMTLDDMERRAITDALRRCDGNLSRVSSLLGITRQALYRRMEKYGITQ